MLIIQAMGLEGKLKAYKVLVPFHFSHSVQFSTDGVGEWRLALIKKDESQEY